MHSKNIKFSAVESGIFIEAALHLQTIYRLDERLDLTEPFSILWPGMGPMKNSQILFLLEAAVSRVMNNLPNASIPLDDYINGTVQYLYWKYTKDCLERSFGDPYRDDMFEALLLRLFNEHLDHSHKLDFEAADANQWTLLADVGVILLDREFPMGDQIWPRKDQGIFDPPCKGDYLRQTWEKLQDARRMPLPI